MSLYVILSMSMSLYMQDRKDVQIAALRKVLTFY